MKFTARFNVGIFTDSGIRTFRSSQIRFMTMTKLPTPFNKTISDFT
jgi:hypothetical protein